MRKVKKRDMIYGEKINKGSPHFPSSHLEIQERQALPQLRLRGSQDFWQNIMGKRPKDDRVLQISPGIFKGKSEISCVLTHTWRKSWGCLRLAAYQHTHGEETGDVWDRLHTNTHGEETGDAWDRLRTNPHGQETMEAKGSLQSSPGSQSVGNNVFLQGKSTKGCCLGRTTFTLETRLCCPLLESSKP